MLGLYIHWPFCLSKCPYCDFNSHVRKTIDESLWQEALLKQMEAMARVYKPYGPLVSVFFGGGTPSLMSPKIVGVLLEKANDLWGITPKTEITLEANPTSVEGEKFKGFAQAGVNRLSLGIQALNDKDLKALGREHSVQEALKALDIGKKTFSRLSFDLIYARPAQTLSQWQEELTKALDYDPEHLSLYQLTIEKGTAFYTQHKMGNLVLPNEELSEKLYDMTRDLCAQKDLCAYEVSNYAKPGEESRHNLIYWRYHDYIGIGPGAHGRLTKGPQKFATQTLRLPEKFLEASKTNGNVWQEVALSSKEQGIEYTLMGLRLQEGISHGRLLKLGGEGFLSKTKLEALKQEHFLKEEGDKIRLTKRGRKRLNAILSYLIN